MACTSRIGLLRSRHHALRRQHRDARIVPEPQRLAEIVFLLVHDVVVPVGRQRAALRVGAYDGRLDEHKQVGLGSLPLVVPEQLAEEGDVTGHRQLVRPVGLAVLDQATQHDDRLVVDDHRGLQRALGQDDTRRRRDRLDAGDLLVEVQSHSAAFGDLRLDAQHHADIAPLEGLERLDGGRRACGGVLPGDERDVLADDNPRFLVVEREQRRRGEDVGIGVLLQRTDEQREIGDHAEPRDSDRAVEDAEVEALPQVAQVHRAADDVVAAIRRSEVGAAESLDVLLVEALQHLPLDAELRGLVRRDLDDQRLDEHLGPAHVEPVDDGAQVVVDGLGPHDDQRVVGDIRLYGHVARVAATAGAAHERIRHRCRMPPAGRCSLRSRHLVAEHRLRGRARRLRDVTAAGQQCAQRLRDARGVGVAQVDDEHVAAGALRRIELLDHRLDARRAAGIVRAQQHAVRSRVRHDHDLLLRVAGLPGLRGGFGADEAVEQRHQVDRRCVPERHDDRLAARRNIERRDDLVDAPQIVRVVGDDERVGAGVGGNGVVGRDQRTQHVDELERRLESQRDDLGHQAVAAAADRSAHHLGALQLRIGLHDQLGHAIALDRDDALQAQRRQQCRIDQFPRHRPRRNDVDRALDFRVEDEVAAGDLGRGLDHGVDVRVHEVERDGVLRGGRTHCQREQRAGGQPGGTTKATAEEFWAQKLGRTGGKDSHRQRRRPFLRTSPRMNDRRR